MHSDCIIIDEFDDQERESDRDSLQWKQRRLGELEGERERLQTEIRLEIEKNPEWLARRYLDAEFEVSYHYNVCNDQEERYGCGTCEHLCSKRSQAKRAMTDEAWAIYNGKQMVDERKERSREYLASCRDEEY